MEGDPATTGRWGPSVVLLPSGALAEVLDALTAETLRAMGPGQWPTGSTGGAHITVRALAPWGTAATDEQVDALRRAATEPVTISFAETHTTDTAVLAVGISPDGSGDRLRSGYASALGPAGWLEDGIFGPSGRDLWYATLVHVAAPVLEQVANRPITASETFTEAHVCEWRFDGRRMVPDVLATVPLR